MTRNYRVIRMPSYKWDNKELTRITEWMECLALCEVYYDKKGKPIWRSETNFIPLCTDIEWSDTEALQEMLFEIDRWSKAIIAAVTKKKWFEILDDFAE